MSTEDRKPRFSFEITEEQNKRAYSILTQYGTRRAIFSKILDDVLDVVETNPMLIGMLMTKNVVSTGVISMLENINNKKPKGKVNKNG
jgi:hypothetical protein